MKHFQIIDESIVFKVSDEQTVESEIQEIVNRRDYKAILAPVQEDAEGTIVMELDIFSGDEELHMTFRAENPTLVLEDGKFVHYWDLRLDYSTETELYEEEDIDTRLDSTMEDILMEELRAEAE